MPIPLALAIPFVVPVLLATVTGIAVHTHNVTPTPAQPIVRELPQTGLTTLTIRPQYRTHDKVLNVYTRSGVRLYKLIQHSADPSSNMQGQTYSILSASHNTNVGTVHVGGAKSEILLRGDNGGYIVVRHVVEKNDSYRVFILPDGETMQWTSKDKFLERAVYDGGTGASGQEIRERIGVARRVGSRIWEIKYDGSKVAGEVVVASAVVSVLDQWSTVFAVGGVFIKKKNKAAVRFTS